MTDKPNVPELPGNVVHYNKWTGFENREIRNLFECIPPEEAALLKNDDTIWLDAEQPGGKVYGFDRARVVSIQDRRDGIMVMYKGPRVAGGTLVNKNGNWHSVHRCTNPAQLVELVKTNPLALETGSVATISDRSREYLKRIGAQIVVVR